jgi:hypothetical protein
MAFVMTTKLFVYYWVCYVLRIDDLLLKIVHQTVIIFNSFYRIIFYLIVICAP